MSILRKLAGQTLIYGSSVILSRLLNFLLVPLYTNVFPTGVYGIVTELYAYSTVILILLTFGMETTYFRFLQDNSSTGKIYQQTLTWVLLLSGVFMLLGVGLHQPIAALLGYENQAEVIWILVLIIGMDALAALPKAKLRHEEKVVRFGLIMLVNVGITLVLNIVFIYHLGLGVEYVFVSNLIASAVQLLLVLYGNIPKRISLNWREFQPLFAYALFIMLAGLSGVMNETLDRMMIPQRWPNGAEFQGVAMTAKEMNGVYGANYKLAMLISLATMAFRYAVEPFFFKQAKEKDSPKTFARIFHYYVLATLIGFLLLSSFARELAAFDLFGIPALLGRENFTFISKEYWMGLQVLPILLLAYVFQAAYINVSIWFKITKQTRYALLFTGVGALITILVNYFGIPRFGYLASAWATLGAYSVMAILAYLVGQKHYPIPYKLGRILLYLLIFLGAFAICYQIGTEAWKEILLKVGVVTLTIALVLGLERMVPVRFFEKE